MQIFKTKKDIYSISRIFTQFLGFSLQKINKHHPKTEDLKVNTIVLLKMETIEALINKDQKKLTWIKRKE